MRFYFLHHFLSFYLISLLPLKVLFEIYIRKRHNEVEVFCSCGGVSFFGVLLTLLRKRIDIGGWKRVATGGRR